MSYFNRVGFFLFNGRSLNRHALSISFLLILLFPQLLLAAAWTQGKGDTQLILSTSAYETNRFVNSEGDSTKAPNFYKFEINPYVEHGVTDRWTLGISPYIQQLTQKFKEGTESRTILSHTDFFARYKWFDTNGWVFSTQTLLKLPGLYSERQKPRVSPKQVDIEGRFLLGYGFQWQFPLGEKYEDRPYPGQNHFFNIEAAYRKRFEEPSNQWRLDGTIGMRPRSDWLLMAQLFSTWSAADGVVNQMVGTRVGFDLVTTKFSFVRQLSPTLSLEVGALQDIYARNTGSGTSAVTSFWYSF